MFGQCRVQGATLRGVEALPVDVEVVVSPGLPGFLVVGMPDAAIQESRERVRAALRASGFAMPSEKVVVNLAPGALRKTGSGFDLPIAVGLLAATGQVDRLLVEGRLFVGELSLEGAVRPVAGSLAYVLCAREAGIRARERAVGRPRGGGGGAPDDAAFARGPAGGGVRACAHRHAAPAGGHARFQRRGGPRGGKTRAADSGRRQSRRADERPAGFGQVHARLAPAVHPSSLGGERGLGDGARAFGRRREHGGGPGGQPAVPQPSPLGQPGRARRRREPAAAGRDIACPQRRPVPGRAARVQARRAGRACASPWRRDGSASRAPTGT